MKPAPRFDARVRSWDLGHACRPGEVASEAAQPGGAAAFDWPQWQGPDRTGIRRRPACCSSGRATGPPLVWSVTGLGAGYGSVAIKGERIFVQGSTAGRASSRA